MHKSQRCPDAVFYKPVGNVTQVRSGYLYKSPPAKRLKREKSWKRRYFVLFKVSSDEHQLKYFRSEEEKDKPLGGIDLEHISLMCVSPQQHQEWIQKIFKCSQSCVLHISAAGRDYFLVGENSNEADLWFSVLYDALKNRPHKLRSEDVWKPIMQKNNSAIVSEKPSPKLRSLSYPLSASFNNKTDKPKSEDRSKRPVSHEPMNPIYDYPKCYYRQNPVEEKEDREECPYETMRKLIHDPGREVKEPGTLMRSVTQVYDKHKTQISPLSEENQADDREDTHPSDVSSSSSSPAEVLESRTVPTLEKQTSTESLDHSIPEEREFEVKQADLKKHLTLTEVDGKPSVSGWTGQPQTLCLFHKGDQVLAINDLKIDSVTEFNMYVSKSLKDEVKLTILRLPGHLPLDSTNCPCNG